MAKVNIVRWDSTNLLPKLLSANHTAMINTIDVTGSAGTLSLGGTDASAVSLGNAGAPVTSLGAFTASVGAEVKVRLDIPSGSDFSISGTLAESNFNGTNFNRLFNGSSVDDLHVHAPSSASLSGAIIPDPLICWTYEVTGSSIGISGSEVVYITPGEPNTVDLADSNAVDSSRILGIVSGTTAVTYDPGDDLCVFTLYGQKIGNMTGLTAGSVYYLSETPGAITTSPDFDSDVTIVRVGIATSPTQLVLQPDIVVRGLT